MSLKVEAGKRYVRADGKVTGPLQECVPSGSIYPFYDQEHEHTYTNLGRLMRDREDPRDIICEYAERTHAPHLITMDGEYQTRDGKPVRVLCVDAPGDQPVVILYLDGNTGKRHENGQFHSNYESNNDLVPRPPQPKKIVRYMNVYDDGEGGLCAFTLNDNREEADCYAGSDRLSCQRIELTKGVFDD